ncbi:hypothetical protein MtrunA17_Chr1g0150651 [Medicago truncatula]|uniref:Transmembrane protein n=2 Tax=Medicago truncatula TaxID=3880 RepID=A0A396JFL6_MEDTR|nr:hypothetical protein MtrunA17_Chr1g0150651 [Medicago truncatula]
MEKVKLRWKSSQAKILGSTVSILGALLVVLYKGPIIIPSPSTQSPPIIHSPITSSTTESNWILGGSLLVIEILIVPIWYIIQVY